jgi:hypothetical protein
MAGLSVCEFVVCPSQPDAAELLGGRDLEVT